MTVSTHSTPQVELRGITKRYPNGFLALDKVTVRLYRGEIHALMGENGAGKSTLLNILYGVHQPTAGQILIGGRPSSTRGHRTLSPTVLAWSTSISS